MKLLAAYRIKACWAPDTGHNAYKEEFRGAGTSGK